MSSRDKAILFTLMFCMVAVGSVVLWVDIEQSKIEARIEAVYAKQIEQASRTTELVTRYQEHEYRINQLEASDQIQQTRLGMHRDELTDAAQMFSDLLASYERLETYMKSHPDNALPVNVSEKDIRDIAALVYLEAGSQSYKCQKAIASVIFNRMMKYHMTAQETLYQRGVFSPASRIKNTVPTSSCLMAVREVIEEGTTLPKNVVAFRNNHYHAFGHPYCHIDGVYFTAV